MGKLSHVVVVVAALVCGACPPPGDGPDGPPDGGPEVDASACGSDRDCAGGSICDKEGDGDGIVSADDDAGICLTATRFCVTDEQCPDGQACFRAGTSNAFCGEGVAICNPVDDDGCADEVCLVSGGIPRCFEAEPVPARCQVVLRRPIAVAGDVVDVGVYAFDANDGLVAASQPGPTVAGCEGAPCNQLVRARVQGVVCAPAPLRALGAFLPGTGAQRVVVVDEQGVGVENAVIRMIDATGAVSQSVTDPDGAVTVEIESVAAVSIVPLAHEQHTIIAPTADLVVVTRSERRERIALDVDIDRSRLHSRGDLLIAAHGLPLSPDLERFSLDALFGAATDVVVDVEGLTAAGGQAVGLPGAMALGLGDTYFRQRGVVVGDLPPGGTAFVWSLAVQAQLSTVGPIWNTNGIDRDSVIDVLGVFAGNADHGLVVLDAPAPQALAEADDVDDNGFPDAAPVVEGAILLSEPATLASLSATVAGAPQATRVLTLLVADIPGAGLLPLGLADHERNLTAAYDAERDVVDHAPPHDGLEGFPVTTVVIAYGERPWRDDDAVAVHVGDAPFAAAPGATVVDQRVIVDAPAEGVDVVHLRTTAPDGRVWNLWTRSAVDADASALGAEALPATFTASLSAIDLEEGAEFSLNNRGGLDDVAAVTRVGCVVVDDGAGADKGADVACAAR